MKPLVFVRTSYVGQYGKIKAKLAGTIARNGGFNLPYTHSLSIEENHQTAAIAWIREKMPLVNSDPIGRQNLDDGYIFAFSLS